MRLNKHAINIALVTGLSTLAVQSFTQPSFAGPTTIRPIEEFVERQGTFCIDVLFNGAYADEIVDGDFVGNCPTGDAPLIFVPPIANFIGQSDPTGLSASIDYAGLADHWAGGAFGTTTAGRVMEQQLDDGRALVQVVLRTRNALTWVVEGGDFAGGPLLFGRRADPNDPNDPNAGGEVALGSSLMQVKFINPAPGYPLPDLLQLFFFPEDGQELLYSGFRNNAEGPLREQFGVEDGTPGRTSGVQNFLSSNPQCGADSPSAVADCFPSERIDLHVIGQ